MQLQMKWGPAGKDPDAAQALVRESAAEIPAGYRLRTYAPGDRGPYLSLMNRGGFASWNSRNLDTTLSMALPGGLFFIEHVESGELVSTTVATHSPGDQHPFGGELGWVATLPAHRGKRLGKTVCAVVVCRFLDAGYTDIYLRTDDWRLPAIKTYLNIGFRPFLFLPEMEGRWREVCRRLGVEWDPLFPPGERPNQDTVERYQKRHLWLPDREHRGSSGSGDMDSFGDESLYRSSELGSARAEPTMVTAGSENELQLSYTAGKAGVARGTLLAFVMRGQNPLGARLFDPDHTRISAPAGRTLSCVPGKGVRFDEGGLSEGETVSVTVSPFPWTTIAARREMKVVLVSPGHPERRLPAPLVFRVLPGAPDRLQVLVGPTRGDSGPGDGSVDVSVSARDAYDNRVDSGRADGPVLLRSGPHTAETALVSGAARARVPSDGAEVVRVHAGTADQRRGFASAASNPSVRSEGLQLYVGDLHCHDFLSEAEGYPDQVYTWARDEKRLDFVSVVPQSHGWHDNQTWTISKYMNERYLEEGRFVTLLGFEWQHSAYGDKVVHFLSGDQPYLPVDVRQYDRPDKLYAALRSSDALVIGHHPAYFRDLWVSGTDYAALETDVERLIELWSMHGSSEGYSADDQALTAFDESNSVMNALRRGLRVGFTGGSDTHRGRAGAAVEEPRGGRRTVATSGGPFGGLTAVWARELTRRGLFEALHARRTYALTGARIVLRFTVNGAPMGSELPLSDRAEIRMDAWAQEAIAQVDVLKDGRLLRRVEPGTDECSVELADEPGGTAYYHCRIVQNDGHRAVCSPVWVG